MTWDGDLFITGDGGDNWHITPGDQFGGFHDITFIDENNGWSNTKRGDVLRSFDGGRTWIVIALRLRQNGRELPLGQMIFVDMLHGWIVNPILGWRTENGGETWEPLPLPFDPNKAVFDPEFVTTVVGWLGGSNGTLLQTTDGGRTLQEVSTPSSADITDLSFIDERTGWICFAPYEGIYETRDGGQSWGLLSSAGKILRWRSVELLGNGEGWAVGDDATGSRDSKEAQENVVLHTTDNGQTWERVAVAQDEAFLHRVRFSDSTHGWLVGRDSVYRTNDGGKTWRLVLTPPPPRQSKFEGSPTTSEPGGRH